MRAFIYVGGSINVNNITEHPKGDDLCIAADSGYENAAALGEHVGIFVGDGDSYAGKLPDSIEVIRLKPEKDLTDTQIAVELAVGRGADDIVIIGGLSGRLDHTLSVIGILEDAKKRALHAVVTDGNNRIRLIRNDSIIIARGGYKYISLIAADETVKGVEIKGVRYPLRKATLTRNVQYAISNEIEGNCAFVAVRKGGLFIVESN